MKYIKTYETIYKIYKDNEPVETEKFSGNDILNLADMKNSHQDIYKKYKFKINNYVKYVGDIDWVDKDDIYQIKRVDIARFEKWKKKDVYEIYSLTNQRFGLWVKQEDLIKATPEDLENYKIRKSGDKYNL
jgi:hypothetical protein